ncbi:MAG TPA: Holliday junction branch migration protein RuvA [Gemmataceae bacterium]
MITKMTGVLNRVLDEEVRLQVGPLEYQVMVPEYVRRQLQMRCGEEVTLHTTEFLEGSQMSNRWIPRRIGFLSEAEIEFFELFCTVEKIGVRKALKAMSRSVKEIAGAIQRQDAKWLATLPGIGTATSEHIVTTLRRKVTRFAMMSEAKDGEAAAAAVNGNLMEDAYNALLTLGLGPMDARDQIDRAVNSGQKFESVQEIITWVFKAG